MTEKMWTRTRGTGEGNEVKGNQEQILQNHGRTQASKQLMAVSNDCTGHLTAEISHNGLCFCLPTFLPHMPIPKYSTLSL